MWFLVDFVPMWLLVESDGGLELVFGFLFMMFVVLVVLLSWLETFSKTQNKDQGQDKTTTSSYVRTVKLSKSTTVPLISPSLNTSLSDHLQPATQHPAAPKTVSHEQLARAFNTEPLEPYTELQQEFLAKLAHEPEMVELFTALMGQHNESLKDRKWQSPDTDDDILGDIDRSTFVLLFLMQYLRGNELTVDWYYSFGDPSERIPWQVVLPQFKPPSHYCDITAGYLPWFVFNYCLLKDGAYNHEDHKEPVDVFTQKRLGKLFADLQQLQPWFRGNRFVFKSGQPPLKPPFFVQQQQVYFTTARMAVFQVCNFDDGSDELVIQDLTYQHELRFEKKSGSPYQDFKHALSVMQHAGVDLSNSIFILIATVSTSVLMRRSGGVEVFTQAVTEVGAHYLVQTLLFPDVDVIDDLLMQGPQVWMVFGYADCKSVFSITLGQQGIGFIVPKKAQDLPRNGSSLLVMASSLDLDAGENRKQLRCAFELFRLRNEYYEAESLLLTTLQKAVAAKKVNPVVEALGPYRLVENDVAQLFGLDIMKLVFDGFVNEQLRKEGKIKDEEVISGDALKDIFADLAVFLHYFALFCKPALQYMRQYRQSQQQ